MPAYAAYSKPLLKIISDKGSICASNAPPFGKPLTKDSPHRSYRPRPTSKPPFARVAHVAHQNNVRIIGKGVRESVQPDLNLERANAGDVDLTDTAPQFRCH